MHRPVRVTPPADLPIDAATVKARAPALADAADATVDALIKAVTDHLEGWEGELGRCLVDQSWRQDFDGFCEHLVLPFPASSITTVSYRKSDGMVENVDQSQYRKIDDGSRSSVRMKSTFARPSASSLDESAAVSVTFVTGYGVPADVPESIREAIVLMVVRLHALLLEEGGLRGFSVDGAFSKQYNSPEMIGRMNSATADMLLSRYRRYAL